MNETTPRGFEPHWQQCLGLSRCERCGKLREPTWRWFSDPAVWKHCYCESCVEKLVAPEPAD